MSVPPTFFPVSGVRFVATYDLVGSPEAARLRAESIAVEQTIEFPIDLLAEDDIRGHIIGRIEALDRLDDRRFRARISYAVETIGGELPQLLNILFGNCSLLPGVRLVGLDLPPELLAMFPGPRYGIDGLRRLFDAPTRPLLATALKPMGRSSEALAEVASILAAGGIDIIKDDHSLANQPFAPFSERVRACAAAVRRTNEESGGRTIYMPALNGPVDEIWERACLARDAGAGGLLVLPGVLGMDVIRWLAESDEIGLPIMAHPAFLGSFLVGEDTGIEHGLLFGTLFRLAGADLVAFPSYGGRFSFSTDACASIAQAAAAPLSDKRASVPAPGGGMTLDRLNELIAFYGPDVALLVGGDLHRGHLLANARRMRAAVDSMAGLLWPGALETSGAQPWRTVSYP